MNLFGKKEPSIGIMDEEITPLKQDADFCLVCLAPGYIDKNNCGDFNIHKDCFVSKSYNGYMFHFKDAKDVWNKKKNNAEQVISLRNML